MGSHQSRVQKKSRNFSKRFQLSWLPSHLIIAIINKTNPNTFKNFYATTRAIKSLVEKGRAEIRILTPFVMEIDFLQASIEYTLRPSWFGKGTSLSLPSSQPLADHFLGLPFFRLAKITFKNYKSGMSLASVLYQLERARVQGEKISFSSIGFSQKGLEILSSSALELSEEGISSGISVPQEVIIKMKSVTLRLENISRLSLQEAFRHIISKAKHVDILGTDEAQESLFHEVFLFSKKIGEGTIRTEGFKLVVFKHHTKSVQNMLEALTNTCQPIYSNGTHSLFSFSEKEQPSRALLYIDWEKEIRIRMMLKKISSKQEGLAFLTHSVPLDKENYLSMAHMKANLLQLCQ